MNTETIGEPTLTCGQHNAGASSEDNIGYNMDNETQKHSLCKNRGIILKNRISKAESGIETGPL